METRDDFLELLYRDLGKSFPKKDLKALSREEQEATLNPIKDKMLTYLQKIGVDTNRISQNLNAIERVYVGTSAFPMAVIPNPLTRQNILLVDKKYVEFDEKGNIAGFNKTIIKQIIVILCHELNHIGSRKEDGKTGIEAGININRLFGLIAERDCDINTDLNEGFTTLIAELIYGFSISPNSNGYVFSDRIAELLCATFGEKECFDSYYNNPKSLEIMCNSLSKNPQFYSKFNILLTMGRCIAHEYGNVPASIEFINKCQKVAIKKILSEIVISKMQKQGKAEKMEYWTRIMSIFSDMPEYRRMIETLIVQYSKLDEKGLKEVKDEISKAEKQLKKEYEVLIKLQSPKNQLFEAGKTRVINEKGLLNQDIVLSGFLRELVLSKQFEYNCPELVKKLSPDKIAQLFSEKNNSQIIEFLPQQTLLSKQEMFAYIKNSLLKNNIAGLNTVREVTDSSEVDISYICVKTDSSEMELKNLKKLLEIFTVENTEEGQVVKNKNTGELLTNSFLIRMVRFANLWHNVVKNSVPSKTIGGSLEESFSSELVPLYEKIKARFQESIKNEDEVDLETIYNDLGQDHDYRLEGMCYGLFSNVENYLTVYRYFSSMTAEVIDETKLPMGLDEIFESWEAEYETPEWYAQNIMKNIGQGKITTDDVWNKILPKSDRSDLGQTGGEVNQYE